MAENDTNRRPDLALEDYLTGVRARDRAILGRAITLVESNRDEHVLLAQQLLTELMPETGRATRVGITGVPGAGKSTFIESLGVSLIEQGHRLAVLAVDPTSGRTGGSILGDKTRMARLSADERAFIRPSPSGGMLGGVARKTRESLLLCEAAGFDVILVETVGVGQSETTVAEMTDLFMALMIPGAGDELQGIKRGLLELVDVIVVNKTDGAMKDAAERAATDYRNAMHLMGRGGGLDTPDVLTCSALRGRGVGDVWTAIEERYAHLREEGLLHKKRQRQRIGWMQTMINEALRRRLDASPAVQRMHEQVEQDVLSGRIPATIGAKLLLDAFSDPP